MGELEKEREKERKGENQIHVHVYTSASNCISMLTNCVCFHMKINQIYFVSAC